MDLGWGRLLGYLPNAHPFQPGKATHNQRWTSEPAGARCERGAEREPFYCCTPKASGSYCVSTHTSAPWRSAVPTM
jgi:hypothetical protein